MANKNENINNEEPIEEIDMNHLMQVRKEKLDKLREAGNDPFKITKFNRTHTHHFVIFKTLKDKFNHMLALMI